MTFLNQELPDLQIDASLTSPKAQPLHSVRWIIT